MSVPAVAQTRGTRDALVALGALVLIAAAGLRNSGAGLLHRSSTMDLLGVLCMAGTTLPLLRWRAAPTATFAGTTAASALSVALGFPPASVLGPTVALYLLAFSRSDSSPWDLRLTLLTGALFAMHFAAYTLGHGKLPEADILSGGLLWGIAWFAGDRRRLRLAEISELRSRAQRAEAEVEQERRLAIAEERARIARDLHDSAGHAINVIAVHAGAARVLQAVDPLRSQSAIETIERVAVQTVAEIDQIVGSLRSHDRPSGGAVEAPAGLGALDALIEQHRAGGMRVQLALRGRPRPLTAAVDLAAYRVLQESLTNAARHGNGSAAVAIEYRDDDLRIEVCNRLGDIDGSARSGGGHGLIGMRERAQLVGGELQTFVRAGRFLLRARFPAVARSTAAAIVASPQLGGRA